MNLRIKMGQLPGDVGVTVKAWMMEGTHPDRKRAKSFRKMMRMRERAVLNRRAAARIAEDCS